VFELHGVATAGILAGNSPPPSWTWGTGWPYVEPWHKFLCKRCVVLWWFFAKWCSSASEVWDFALYTQQKNPYQSVFLMKYVICWLIFFVPPCSVIRICGTTS